MEQTVGSRAISAAQSIERWLMKDIECRQRKENSSIKVKQRRTAGKNIKRRGLEQKVRKYGGVEDEYKIAEAEDKERKGYEYESG
jgi:hypothetical protein